MKSLSSLLVFILLIFAVSIALGYQEGEEFEGGHGGRGGKEEEEQGRDQEVFLLRNSKEVIRTEAGLVRVVKGYVGKDVARPMHIGFMDMEPGSLFLPQYMDSSLILFLRHGEAKIGWIYKDRLVEKNLKGGDLYRIPAGSTFYIVNTGEGQRLQFICSIDTSESLGIGPFQSFFIGGGVNPPSVLAGFDARTLTTAFNVTPVELGDMLTRQRGGAIVFANATDAPKPWAAFLELKHIEGPEQECDEDDYGICMTIEEHSNWRKFVNFVFGETNKKRTVGAPDAYNLFDRAPDFENKYGSSKALDKSDYAPLRHADIGVYYVNLTAGAMMAPHVNPTATEYGVVLRGSGSIQVVYPNGSSAMNTKVNEGDVFWVPRYFPFCQIASRDGPMEFFGFTSSARKNRPQFLVGASSLLRTMKGPELATAFGISEERFSKLVDAQTESVILPPATVTPQIEPGKDEPHGEGKKKEQEKEKKEEEELKPKRLSRAAGVLERFGEAIVMDLD